MQQKHASQSLANYFLSCAKRDNIVLFQKKLHLCVAAAHVFHLQLTKTSMLNELPIKQFRIPQFRTLSHSLRAYGTDKEIKNYIRHKTGTTEAVINDDYGALYSYDNFTNEQYDIMDSIWKHTREEPDNILFLFLYKIMHSKENIIAENDDIPNEFFTV